MSHLFPSYSRSNLAFERGEGPWLFTASGEAYFDFAAGIAVNAFGHANPRVASAIADQAGKLMHTSNLYQIPEQEKLADQLCQISFADYVFFTNSGAEAVECAIKTVRRYHHDQGDPRHKIIAFDGAFHGRTLATIAAAGAPKLVDGFGPMPEGFIHIQLTEAAVTEAIDEQTAAILIEPIQGEGGIRPIPDSFLRFLRSEADRVGALLIFDEIQCGMGRTGRMFAYEYSGVEPDIMALAKGIGGGFPLGACLANQRTGSVMVPGTHGSTYGGSPMACRVGNEVVSMMRDPNFLPHVQTLGRDLSQELSSLVDRHPNLFESLRGEGLMLGIKCKINAADFVEAGRANGVLTVPAGDNVVRLLPPLNMTHEEMQAGIARLEATAATMEQTL